MKVLQINSVCGYGSTGKIAVDLCYTLQDNGHSCKIAYGRGEVPANIDTIKIGNKMDIYRQVIATRLFDKHGSGSHNATMKLIQEIKDYDPDIIHLHNIHGYYININDLFNYLAQANKPIIWTLHDCWPITGHCSYFDYIKCNKWKNECYDCPQKKAYPKSIFIDSSKQNYNNKKMIFNQLKNLTIITPSKWLEGIIQESFLSSYSIKTIHNGIDLNIFRPTESRLRRTMELTDKKIILGVANSWEKRKGLNTFIQLSEALEEAYTIILIGVSKKQRKKLPKNIITIDRTNNQKELAQFYTIADVFLNPTLEDNFPTTNLEALACGTPVITFDTGGSPESLDETCGAIVEKNNLEQTIKSIKLLTHSNMQMQCIQRAKNYDKNVQYQKYIDEYKKKE